jgi:hypothetical protein
MTAWIALILKVESTNAPEEPGFAAHSVRLIYGIPMSQMCPDFVDNSQRLKRRCASGATVASPTTRD